MPVMLTRSLFTELEISNGTNGIFKQLIYEDTESDINNNNEIIDKTIFSDNTIYVQKPVFALIEINESRKVPNLPGLPHNIIPIPLEEVNLSIDISKLLPTALKKKSIRPPIIKIKRKQFPLVPAFAYTTHKSQGQTIPKVVLDLKFPPPPFPKEIATSYVPLTRVKVMDDLVFCREFPLSSLQIQPSKDQTKEIQRLEDLNNVTKKKLKLITTVNYI